VIRMCLLVLLMVLLSGCGAWERKMSFYGPRETSVQILQPFPANGWGLRVVLESDKQSTMLFDFRGDAFLWFADVVWSPKGDAVAVFTCGTPTLRLAYDIRGRKPVSFIDLQELVGAHIRAEYGLHGEDTEPLKWACSQEGTEAFMRTHPQARAR
jgi:hypothetical protein